MTDACPTLTAGWTEYFPTRTIQFEGAGTNNQYCAYSNTGGIELFKMMKNPAGVIQRCEARVNNDYLTGRNQFEGDLRLTAANATCLHQVFKFLMIVGYPQNGGELHQHSAAFLESGVDGIWVHVNTVHDTHTKQADIYLGCAHKYTTTEAPPPAGGWYNKYGLYGIDGLPPVDPVSQVEWKNVRYYRQP
jgi:hypothetical protein